MSEINLKKWSERAPMPLPMAGCAVAAWEGKLVVAGGTRWIPEKKVWESRVDAFDPASNRWTALPALPQPHGDAACQVVGGTLMIFGGGRDGSVETTVWSLRGGAWHDEAALALPETRKSLASAVVGNTVYLFGGLSRANDPASTSRTTWAWTSGEKGWKSLAPVPGVARNNPAVAVVDGIIYLAGGYTMDKGPLENIDEIVAYDPRADRWTSVGKLPFPNRAASGLGIGGKLVVVGGYNTAFEKTISSFDPKTGKIDPKAGELPHALADSRFVLLGGKAYGVGGENGVKMRAPYTLEA